MKVYNFNYFFLLITFFFLSCTHDTEPSVNNTNEEAYNSAYRPQIHFSSKYNWINDPNGLVYFDGEYHLFFQHNPFGSGWGYMSWGHAVSTDLIHWTQLNVALKPDTHGDVFSGSVVIDKNNTAGFGENAMIAIYTSAGSSQAQSIAFSTDRGRTFIKYRDNPILKNPGKPDFRDPKVFWHELTQQWIMSLATGQTISFYRSLNLKEWTKLSEFGLGIGAHDGVWECPDLFPLMFEGKTKWVLLLSINPGAPNGGSGTQYFIGDFNGTTFTADALSYPMWLDYGKDNYAGITWDNIPELDGRRILISWMNNWEYAGSIPQYSTGSNGSRSSMTLPRELTLGKNSQGYLVLKNKVISEINNIASSWTTIADEQISIEKNYSLNLGGKKAYQIHLSCELMQEQILTLSLMNDSNNISRILIDKLNQRISFFRNNSGMVSFSGQFSGSSYASFVNSNSQVTLDIYVDQSSIEVFVNDGELSLTNQVFPKSIYNKISIVPSLGIVSINAKYRVFDSIWQ